MRSGFALAFAVFALCAQQQSKHVVGTVEAVTSTELRLKTDRMLVLSVSPQIEVYKGKRYSDAFALHPGEMVRAEYHDDSGRHVADVMRSSIALNGRIKGFFDSDPTSFELVSPTLLDFRGRGLVEGFCRRVRILPETKFENVSAALKEQDDVLVVGWDGSNEVLASRITKSAVE